jgi:hypothetical protein
LHFGVNPGGLFADQALDFGKGEAGWGIDAQSLVLSVDAQIDILDQLAGQLDPVAADIVVTL